MKPMHPIVTGAAAALWIVAVSSVSAQPEEPKPAPEKTKRTVEEMTRLSEALNARQRQRDLQAQALKNLNSIGEALYKFKSMYGGFPSEKTAAVVMEKRGITEKLGVADANACFLQLVAAHLLTDTRVFTFEKPEEPEVSEKEKEEEEDDHECDHVHSVEKCSFAFIPVPESGGHSFQPVAVAPLVKGKTTFDPSVFGGFAVILRVDKSAVVAPVDKDGRVMLEGMDLFDPGQSYWKDKVPQIKWPAD